MWLRVGRCLPKTHSVRLRTPEVLILGRQITVQRWLSLGPTTEIEAIMKRESTSSHKLTGASRRVAEGGWIQ